MKKKYVILLFIAVVSNLQGQNSESKIDSIFKKCFEKEIEKRNGDLIDLYGPKVKDITNDSNLLQLFEKFLIDEKLLLDNNQENYIELFKNIRSNKTQNKILEKFLVKFDFDPYEYFYPFLSLHCYGYVERLNLIDENNWRYQVILEYNYYEADGKDIDNHLIKSLSLVPKKEFEKIYYRQLFLNEIYFRLYVRTYK